MAEIPKELVRRARLAIKEEEREKAFLKDKSEDAPALRPSNEFIDQNLGKSRDPKETAEAVLDRARAYQRNMAPPPDYVHRDPKSDAPQRERLRRLTDRAKDFLSRSKADQERER